MKHIIGIDFDNTIVKYDEVFHQTAIEKNLIPSSVPVSKEAVRSYLLNNGKEEEWTNLQGFVYGTKMENALPFKGVIIFFKSIVEQGIPIYIISHKTIFPYLGPQYNLHEAAFNWLLNNGFFDDSIVGMNKNNVFFELTKKEKIKRISSLGCTIFFDDLQEILLDKEFPNSTKKVLFSSHESINNNSLSQLNNWEDLDTIYKLLS